MAGKANVIKTVSDLTAKQRRFVEIYVANFGYISKTEPARHHELTLSEQRECATEV